MLKKALSFSLVWGVGFTFIKIKLIKTSMIQIWSSGLNRLVSYNQISPAWLRLAQLSLHLFHYLYIYLYILQQYNLFSGGWGSCSFGVLFFSFVKRYWDCKCSCYQTVHFFGLLKVNQCLLLFHTICQELLAYNLICQVFWLCQIYWSLDCVWMINKSCLACFYLQQISFYFILNYLQISVSGESWYWRIKTIQEWKVTIR